MNIIQAIESEQVFKPLFDDLRTWEAWLVFLKSLFALPMERNEKRLFRKCTGLKKAPTMKAREAYVVAGRRSGKSYISSVIATYLALFYDWRPYLAPGERGHIFIVAVDKRQATVIKGYISAVLHSSKGFERMIKRETQECIDLNNRISIMVKTASYRSLRGFTILCGILDELSFFRDENSANPDKEILNALRPALATIPDSLLIGISTPYSRSGVLWEMYRSHFGKGGKDAPLIWQASTETMNPMIDKRIIKNALKEDRSAAQAEWLSIFREDIESFLPSSLLEIAVYENRLELPKQDGVRYFAHADSSGGRQDSFTLAIAHRDERSGRIVLDVLREKRPPFKPSRVVEEFSQICKEYEVSQLVADNYAGDWVTSNFRDHGIMVENSKLSASEIYTAALPFFSNASIELLDNQRLISQLRSLERRTRAGGKDLISHPNFAGAHDDLAVVVCGVAVQIYQHASIVRDMPPSLGYSEEVMTEEEKIKRAFDDEMLGKKKSKDEEGLDADFDESEWDLTRMSAFDVQRELDKLEGKKAKKSPVKIIRGWD